MGGLGSGRQGQREGRRTETRECHAVAIADWVRQGLIKRGHTYAYDGNQGFSIIWTGCSYGGSRPWFQCPLCGRRAGKLFAPTASKQRWSSSLNIRTSYGCRVCLRLTYQSSNVSGDVEKTCQLRTARLNRKLARARKLEERQAILRELAIVEVQRRVYIAHKLAKASERALKLVSQVETEFEDISEAGVIQKGKN